ncbi:hypothetical protein D3C81_2044620 [compost metagenome]
MQIRRLGKNRLAEIAEHGHSRAGKQPFEIGILERRIILAFIDKYMPYHCIRPNAL